MIGVAARIAAASGDAGALLALAVELSNQLAAESATVAELRSADESRREKQAKRTRDHRSRNATSCDVTLQDVTERDVTEPPSPQVSSSFPTPHITPSFPPPPQQPPRARDEASPELDRLLSRVPGSASGVILAFLDGMSFAKRLGWVAVFHEVMDDRPQLSGLELAKAVSNFTANVDRQQWNTAYFRGYCRGVRKEIAEDATPADAGKAFAAIRALITERPNPGRGVIRIIPKADVQALGSRVATAYEQVGGSTRFLDSGEKLGFLLRDFEKAFEGASA